MQCSGIVFMWEWLQELSWAGTSCSALCLFIWWASFLTGGNSLCAAAQINLPLEFGGEKRGCLFIKPSSHLPGSFFKENITKHLEHTIAWKWWHRILIPITKMLHLNWGEWFWLFFSGYMLKESVGRREINWQGELGALMKLLPGLADNNCQPELSWKGQGAAQ